MAKIKLKYSMSSSAESFTIDEVVFGTEYARLNKHF